MILAGTDGTEGPPRGRAQHAAIPASTISVAGPSLRMQGARQARLQNLPDGGTIPAGAGGGFSPTQFVRDRPGAIPRWCGKLPGDEELVVGAGTIPTGAGST